MRFFGTAASEPEPEPDPDPVLPVWWQPEATLPGAVGVDLLLVHTDTVAVALTEVQAYPAGFACVVVAVLRERDRSGLILGAPDGPIHGGPVPAEKLRFGVRFADGRAVTNLARRPDWRNPEPGGPVLMQMSGGSDGRRVDLRLWVWPLPPPGPVTFACEWPAFGVPESTADLDAAVILDAAARAVDLWPSAG